MVAIRDIDSSIPDPLDNWLMSGFDRYDRLKKTTKRACLATTLDFSNVLRWELNEEITEQAPRNDLTNSEEACREIREKLLAQVPLTEGAPDMPPEVESCVEEILDDTTNPITCPKSGQRIEFGELETAMEQTSILSYDEVPIGFETSPVNGGSFTYDNVCWIRPAKGLYKIRNFLQSQDGGDEFIKKAQRISYQTARAQTGDYKTNREHRWEAHPNDPQAATRWKCWKIEKELLSQSFQFADAPSVPSQLETVLSEIIDIESESLYRCPITGWVIDFTEVMNSVRNPSHGVSELHCGHIKPITTQRGMHEPDNVTWMTAKGNKIQGNDSVQHTVEVIFNIAQYHKSRLSLDWDETENWEAEETE